MKKILHKIIVISILFVFFVPLSIGLNKNEVSAAETWYYTRLGDMGYNQRVNSIEYTLEADCLKDLKSVDPSREPSTICYKKSVVVKTENTTEGTYWFRDADNAFRGTKGALALPGFTTDKECEDAKNVYWGPNSNNAASKLPCSLISSEQVLLNFEAEKKINAKMPGDPAIPITPKINVAENKSIYTMLAPIGDITCMDSSGQDPKCITNDIGKYLNIIFKLAIGICAALAVIMLIINGVKYMGDESVFGKTEAKKQMFGAIVGLLIALGAWALLNTINPALTGQNGLNISSANVEIVPLYDRGYNDPKQANGESTRCTPVTNPASPCTPDKLEKIFPGKGTQMSKICNMESSGIENLASGTDYCMPPGKSLPFSFGLFQVNLSANGGLASTTGLDCSNLFDKAVGGADAIEPKYTSGYTCNLLQGKLDTYNACKARLLDTTINLAIAKSLFNNSKGMGNWTGDKKYCASAFQ